MGHNHVLETHAATRVSDSSPMAGTVIGDDDIPHSRRAIIKVQPSASFDSLIARDPQVSQGGFRITTVHPAAIGFSLRSAMRISVGDGETTQLRGDSFTVREGDDVAVAVAVNHGLEVGNAQGDGVRVTDADGDGIQIGDGTLFPTTGLRIPSPGTPGDALLPNTSDANGQWALFTTDDIQAGNIFASAQTLVAVVGGDQALAPGDVVAAFGTTNPIPGSHNRLAQVHLAGVDQANIVGVVSGRMVLVPLPGGEGEQDLRSVAGPAHPGDYVAITVLGVAQVKVQAGGAIRAGQRLTVADTSGHARALRTVEIEGVEVDESGPMLGTALDAADKNGMVWVLVNPQ